MEAIGTTMVAGGGTLNKGWCRANQGARALVVYSHMSPGTIPSIRSSTVKPGYPFRLCMWAPAD